MAKRKAPLKAVTKKQFEQLADFRYQLRLFLRFSEQVSREHGITPIQYQLLLQIRGFPDRDWATVGELAERLQVRHNAMVSLLTRCEVLGLVERTRSETDGRAVHITLTRQGLALLGQLAPLHHAELQTLRDVLPPPAPDR